MHFEVATETKSANKEFLDEVTEKVQAMLQFKKTYMKFNIGLEAYLKKD